MDRRSASCCEPRLSDTRADVVLGLFDPSGTSHSGNALHGLAHAAHDLAIPTTVYAHPSVDPSLAPPSVSWIQVEGVAEFVDDESRLTHRRTVNRILGEFDTGPNRIFCDLGLDRTMRSQGTDVPSDCNTLFVCHRSAALDVRPVRILRRLRRQRARNRRVLRDLGRTGARFVAHTDVVAERLADFVPADQVVKLGWPVQSRRAEVLDPNWVPHRVDTTVLFAGSLRAEKGFLPLLDAVQGVPGFDRLVVPGRIPKLFRDQISITDPRVELWDRWLTTNEYEATFASAALVILPYVAHYRDRGTMSSVLLEALAYGRPLVVSDSIAHLLPPNYNGAVVVDVSTPASIAAGVRRALSQLSELEHAAMTDGRRFIAEHHTYEGYIDGIVRAGTRT